MKNISLNRQPKQQNNIPKLSYYHKILTLISVPILSINKSKVNVQNIKQINFFLKNKYF